MHRHTYVVLVPDSLPKLVLRVSHALMLACAHIVSLLTLAVAGGGLAVIAAETVRLEEGQVHQNVEGVSVGLSGFIAIYSLRYRCSYCSQGHLGPVVSMACDSTSTLLATGWLQPLLELYTIHFPTSPDMSGA